MACRLMCRDVGMKERLKPVTTRIVLVRLLMAAHTQSAVSDFNPRLRLDLSSGQGSLRSLRESTARIHGGVARLPSRATP